MLIFVIILCTCIFYWIVSAEIRIPSFVKLFILNVWRQLLYLCVTNFLTCFTPSFSVSPHPLPLANDQCQWQRAGAKVGNGWIFSISKDLTSFLVTFSNGASQESFYLTSLLGGNKIEFTRLEATVLWLHDVHQTILFWNHWLNLTSVIHLCKHMEISENYRVQNRFAMKGNNCLCNTSEWFTSTVITAYFTILRAPALRGVYIKNKLQSGPSSLNTQTHAIQMNFSPHDQDFRAKYFSHEIHAREIDTCCLGNY